MNEKEIKKKEWGFKNFKQQFKDLFSLPSKAIFMSFLCNIAW